ncbi:MAG: hypothetical protein C0599_13925 [Salinivirgaceae bacterium]|nr:MAG: hypothetical protein C0599_13925 [Salinivirgaceae bacterium]
MRKLLLFAFAAVLFSSNVIAQQSISTKPTLAPAKKNFIGLGTGINADTGFFGAVLNFGLSEKSMLGLAGGIGGWGFKAATNMQFHPKGYYKHFFKVGVSVASGISEITLPMETVEYGDTDVSMRYNPVYNANLSIGYNFKLGNSGRLYIEGGYAITLTEDAYEVLDDVELTSDTKSILDMQTPGGIRLALGIDFGI